MEDQQEQHHIVSKKLYFTIFLTLIIMTFLTRKIAEYDLGEWSTIIAISIAIFKASLVVLFFMHVRYSDHLIQFVVVAGLFWLGILLALTFGDYFTRSWLPLLH
jgi:cytochrome c oxidase subunit 4